MKRREFIRTASVAGSLLTISHLASASQGKEAFDFPLIDLHVHLARNFDIDKVMEVSKKSGVRFGIVVNPGYGVNDDASLLKHIESLLPYPVYIGLQPMSPGWSKNFSPAVISKLDYVIMDAQTIPFGNKYGETLMIWNFDTYVDDPEKFMETYMNHILTVINNNEPLTTFGWPLFLPVCIARDYNTLWTDDRMNKIITALKAKKLNIEINDLARTPHERFINMAKDQGLMFTFGSDTRDQKAGRLDYCKYIAKKCNLKQDDFWVPSRKI